MMSGGALLALLAALLLATAALATEAPPYNEVRQKSSHNAYQRDEALLEQLVFHGIRSIELDVHNGKGGRPRTPGDWFVYHDSSAPGTSCDRLSDCLDVLRAFHLAHPRHEVVTVWLDLKDNFERTRRPEDLDARILQHLDPAWVVTPAHLMAACPGATALQRAVTGACHWPSLDAMRGRFLIVLTGGSLSSAGGRLDTYVAGGSEAVERLAFIAPDLADATRLGARADVVFFNLKLSRVKLAERVHAEGFVSRVWGVNSAEAWFAALRAQAHHLATDKVNAGPSPWASLRHHPAWPFDCLGDLPCAGNREPLDLLGAETTSGDLWSTRDSFAFAWEPRGDADTHTWTAQVHAADSHVNAWAKGCLMARDGTEPEARYFAVCRPANKHPLRVQYRDATGGPTRSVEPARGPRTAATMRGLAFLRMTVTHDGERTCATGAGSSDGATWNDIARHCFHGRLDAQGLALSAHGTDPVKMLFGNVRRDGVLYRRESFPNMNPIGAGVRQGTFFDGPAPEEAPVLSASRTHEAPASH
ncbi:hypothetical protein KRR26_18440 [Corallococcus sp. M34]|uniref:Ca2+-dependent phosphoinositide-specific phospholipase C n=1 Tax=Citreicoccus inhibens TaxID=2849499 RepID=UPI001C24E875|nr:Ca2+-dependent phosphoinositide-specific phospholipase C [Citreicoccus inhibens]MBU8897599.1 hypothetical protein [Citreicoccus inhibens]